MEDRVVAISGAGRRPGPTVARAFFGTGATLAVAGRDGAKLDALGQSLGAPPTRFLASSVDLGDPAAARKWAGEVSLRFGRVDVVIHLVGGYVGGGFHLRIFCSKIGARFRQSS